MDRLTEEAVDAAPGQLEQGFAAIKMKIAAPAQAHPVQCIPQAWGIAIGLAATLHCLASLPDCPLCLVPIAPMLKYEQTFNPLRDALSKAAPVHAQGRVSVPARTGLGIEIDREVLDG